MIVLFIIYNMLHFLFRNSLPFGSYRQFSAPTTHSGTLDLPPEGRWMTLVDMYFISHELSQLSRSISYLQSSVPDPLGSVWEYHGILGSPWFRPLPIIPI